MENTAQTLWDSCTDAIRSQVSDIVWQMNFHSAQPLELLENELTIIVPSETIKERIEGRYREIVQDAISEAANDGLLLRIEVSNDEEFLDKSNEDEIVIKNVDSDEELISKPLKSEEKQIVNADLYGLRLTFDDFVVGTSNRFATAAAQAVAATPGRSYNPLFIYGDAGLGKTHLLHAIANYVRDHYPTHRVRYVSLEVFMNHFVEAIRNKTQSQFKQHYR